MTRWLVERAITDSEVDSRGRLIVLALLTRVDNTTVITRADKTPSFEELATMTGLSKAVLSEWMNALEDGGWIARDKSGAGRGARTIYKLAQGADRIERRSRDLRQPRRAKKSSPSEPFSEAETVRPANASEGVKRSPSEPQSVRPANAFTAEKGSPSEPPPYTKLLPTGEDLLKTPQSAASPEAEPTTGAQADSSSVRSWKHNNIQPRTEGTRVPRQPSLFDVRRSEIDRGMEVHKVIGHWLQANGYPGASLDDCRAVHQELIRRHTDVKDMLGYIRRIAAAGGFYEYYRPIVEARADEIARQVRRLTDGQPDCGHGYPGGTISHPTTGLPLCPFCKTGQAPQVQRLTETTHPDVVATLDAYRAAYRKAHGATPLLPVLMSTTAEAETLRKGHVTPDHLVSLAALAGRTGSSLLEAARSLKGQAA